MNPKCAIFLVAESETERFSDNSRHQGSTKGFQYNQGGYSSLTFKYVIITSSFGYAVDIVSVDVIVFQLPGVLRRSVPKIMKIYPNLLKLFSKYCQSLFFPESVHLIALLSDSMVQQI